MASVWIQERRLPSGADRYDVKWEGPTVELVGGRRRSQLHCGTFRTEREAKARARWVRDEWAAGRVPDPRKLVLDREPQRRLRYVAEEWLTSRIDLADSSRLQYRSRVDRIARDLGGYGPDRVTRAMVREWVARLAEEFKPSTVGIYLHVLRLVLDFAEVDPNPARHRSVKLPAGRTTNVRIRLPSTGELAAIRRELPPEARRLLDFLEDTGAEISAAAVLDWRDVHADRVLVRGTKRSARVRFILAATSPIRLLADGRAHGPVFAYSASGFRSALTTACRRAGVGPYSPHDLRHLHLSRLLHAGVSPAIIAARAGHATPATTLKTYSHVLPPD